MPSFSPFRLERYFAKYEFNARYLLSPSDCESLSLSELLLMADSTTQALWNGLSLGYTESPGHPLLREEISKTYQQIQPRDVLVLTPEEGIFIAMQTLLTPGDEVVAVHPAYQSLHEVARAAGAHLIPWTLIPESNTWRLDLAALERSITPRTRLLIINFPHNPTGFLPTREELSAVVDLARRHGLYIFSDEMYRMLEYREEERLPAICDLYELGISLSGMSKTFSLPGLRIGWLATRAEGWIERWQMYKDYTTICSSAPSEVLALIGLRARNKIIERNLAIIRHNLSAAADFFSAHTHRFVWFPPLAGSTAFPKWTGPSSVEDFCQESVEKAGVMIVPGSMFDDGGGHFRVGLGRLNFPEALACLDNYLQMNHLI